jgi:hypothetical protein
MDVSVRRGVKKAFHRSRRRLSLKAAGLSSSCGILDEVIAAVIALNAGEGYGSGILGPRTPDPLCPL